MEYHIRALQRRVAANPADEGLRRHLEMELLSIPFDKTLFRRKISFVWVPSKEILHARGPGREARSKHTTLRTHRDGKSRM